LLPRETIIAYLSNYSSVEEASINYSHSLAIFKIVMDSAIEKATLSDRQRECAWRYYVRGDTQSSIAGDLGVSQATINEHINVAIDKIRRQTKGVDDDFREYKR